MLFKNIGYSCTWDRDHHKDDTIHITHGTTHIDVNISVTVPFGVMMSSCIEYCVMHDGVSGVLFKVPP